MYLFAATALQTGGLARELESSTKNPALGLLQKRAILSRQVTVGQITTLLYVSTVCTYAHIF
jgi:hypothetical protein